MTVNNDYNVIISKNIKDYHNNSRQQFVIR